MSANRRIFHSPLIANSAKAFTPRPLTRNLNLRPLGLAARQAGLYGMRLGGFSCLFILHSLYGCDSRRLAAGAISKKLHITQSATGRSKLFHTGIARSPTGGVVIYLVRLTLYGTGKQYHHQRLERETRGSPYQFGCALCEQNDFVAAPLPSSGLRACISPVARWSCWAVALTHNTTPLFRLRDTLRRDLRPHPNLA